MQFLYAVSLGLGCANEVFRGTSPNYLKGAYILIEREISHTKVKKPQIARVNRMVPLRDILSFSNSCKSFAVPRLTYTSLPSAVPLLEYAVYGVNQSVALIPGSGETYFTETEMLSGR